MINPTTKYDCCGCWACEQICPKHCISMVEDCEGFVYPSVDKNLCIDCHLCEKVCPVINQNEPRKPLEVYAAKNPNEEIRMQSSSGGIFTLLAEYVINQGGVVFGAKFNENWEVIHDYTETIEGIAPFRGSKYVQSKIGDNYIKVEKFLKDERNVLFSGTPCQIAGLKKYLRKEYKNLLTIDVVCHGVPSPLVWRDYLKSISNNDRLTNIFFRDKSTGWSSYSTYYCIQGKKIRQKSSRDMYMQGFLKNIYLRPSCYKCPSKNLKSRSDITFADFWGVENVLPEMDDNKGTSLVICNTGKGKQKLLGVDTNCVDCNFEDAVKYNSAILESSSEPSNRSFFFKTYNQLSIIDQIREFTKPTIKQRIRMSLPVRAAFKIVEIIFK